MVLPILKRVAIGVALATLVVFGVGLFLPRTYTVSRSVIVDAPRARLHELCGDLAQWPAWTPWLLADPGVVVTLGPVTSGVGARQSWRGEDGAGELVFTGSDPEHGIAFDLDFRDRGERTASTIAYAAAPGGGVEVAWTLVGDSGWDIMARYLGLLMDPLLGPMLEDGLERLKLVAEDRAPDAVEAAEAADE